MHHIPNIDSRGRYLRLGFGLVALSMAMTVGALLALGGFGRWYGLLLWPLYWAAALGVLQAKDST